MTQTFSEIKLFQVKPSQLEAFEALIPELIAGQKAQPGCLAVRYTKRFYTVDGIELGEPPRELTKIIKCVKYYAYWEFDTKENYGKGNGWFFENHAKIIQKLLIAPFDISCGVTFS